MTATEVLGAVGGVLGGIVTIISGVWVARVQRKSSTETAGVTTGATLLTEAVKSWQVIAEDAKRTADKATAEMTELRAKVDGLARDLDTERNHSADQDRRINALRTVLHAWAQFGRELHEHWAEVRQNHYPPPLPEYDDPD